MPLTKLQFRPGINKEITAYSNEGGWVDGDKIRFRFGFPEKIGGWDKYTTSTYLGTPRSLHAWVTLAGDKYLAVGTSQKYYIESGGSFNDITPVRLTVRQPFSVTGVASTTGIGTATVFLPVSTTIETTGVSATTSLGLVSVSFGAGAPLFGTGSVGDVSFGGDVITQENPVVPVGD